MNGVAIRPLSELKHQPRLSHHNCMLPSLVGPTKKAALRCPFDFPPNALEIVREDEKDDLDVLGERGTYTRRRRIPV